MQSTLLAALLGLSAGPGWAQSASIGRLFTTPEQRLQLDIQRGLIAPPPAPPAAAPPPAPAPLTVNGVVQRSGGGSTVWLNQAPQRGAKVSGSGKQTRVSVTLPSGQRVLVKPGQSVDADAGTISDGEAP